MYSRFVESRMYKTFAIFESQLFNSSDCITHNDSLDIETISKSTFRNHFNAGKYHDDLPLATIPALLECILDTLHSQNHIVSLHCKREFSCLCTFDCQEWIAAILPSVPSFSIYFKKNQWMVVRLIFIYVFKEMCRGCVPKYVALICSTRVP